MRTVFLISGKAGAGKDTFGRILADELIVAPNETHASVITAHFADLVKHIAVYFFDWDGEKDTFGRTLLQTIGTDVVRAKDPDYWVRFLIQVFDMFHKWDFAVIPDWRFPNELAALREAGFDVYTIRVRRTDNCAALSNEQKRHSSETSLDTADVDCQVYNNGTIEDLVYEAKAIVQEVVYG